ncbi:diguanylate cyclase domain-containing protein, partial [Pyxidicoccus sp. 3LG]
RWVARPFPVPGGIAQMLTLSDIVGAPSPREERERLLRVDALTGLDTRRVGEERLLREIGRCRRDGVPFGVLLMDLVGLGALTTTRGFDAGDAALRDVARQVELLGTPPASRCAGRAGRCCWPSRVWISWARRPCAYGSSPSPALRRWWPQRSWWRARRTHGAPSPGRRRH